MFSLRFRCIYCGFKGVLEMPGASDGLPVSRIFKYLGDNPYSGHMHYQCPSCEIVMLVDPADFLHGRSGLKRQDASRRVHDHPVVCVEA